LFSATLNSVKIFSMDCSVTVRLYVPFILLIIKVILMFSCIGKETQIFGQLGTTQYIDIVQLETVNIHVVQYSWCSTHPTGGGPAAQCSRHRMPPLPWPQQLQHGATLWRHRWRPSQWSGLMALCQQQFRLF